ncbi:hypothetical protein WL93_24085 [Burkholderia diffusa]|uniref:helix-turn-helix transcriptional regulator n=1 Tax=Burkholderia diffusa TaxID=488732 RepID=UPI00075755CF|nr:LuxR C-terminal-related transcriptional regulator [Burkholderia diffusa]KWF80453.1 hypothetical protein WL93_24085 [Burkholderia diffusa]
MSSCRFNNRYQIEHPNLAFWLEQSIDATIVLLSAPAGYGKTTLLQAFHWSLSQAGQRTAWLTLGPEDNDAGRFSLRLLEALGIAASLDAPPATLMDVSDAASSQTKRVFDALARPPEPVAIFLDDFDRIEAPDLLHIIERMLEAKAPEVRLFVATRAQPALRLIRWKVHGSLLQIGQRDLAFGIEQASELLNVRHAMEISRADVERLVDVTEGWPTGLQLMALSLEAGIDRHLCIERFREVNADISEYLVQEVFDALPEALRRFMLDTCILTRLCAPIANAVAGTADASASMRELERRNLFVQRDPKSPGQLRLHRMFRDFLQRRLSEENPAKVALLNQRAAEFEDLHGDPDMAIEYALQHVRAGGAPALANDLLESRVWPALLAGQTDAVLRWLHAVSAADCSPALRIALGWALVLQHRYAEADALVRNLGSQLDAPELQVLEPMTLALVDHFDDCEAALAKMSEPANDGSRSGCTLLNVLGYVHLVNLRWEQALAAARAARAGFEALGSRYGMAFAITIEAYVHMARADDAKALALLLAAQEDMARYAGEDTAYGAQVSVSLAEVLYQRGHFREARALLQRYARLVRETGIVDTIVTCHRLLSRLHCQAGDYALARRAVQAAAEVGERTGLPRIVASMRLEEHFQTMHQYDHGWLDHLPALPADDPVWSRFSGRIAPGNAVEQPLVAQIRLLLRTNGAAQVLREIEVALPIARQRGENGLAWHLRLLQAHAYAVLGDDELASELLAELVEERAGHCAGALADEGPVIRSLCMRLSISERAASNALLRRTLQWALESHTELRCAAEAADLGKALTNAGLQVEQVLQPAPAMPAHLVTAATESLSARELDIVRCLALGLSNKHIASQLHISEPTVKFHLRNINSKLGAQNRTHAVFIARQAGWVT